MLVVSKAVVNATYRLGGGTAKSSIFSPGPCGTNVRFSCVNYNMRSPDVAASSDMLACAETAAIIKLDFHGSI